MDILYVVVGVIYEGKIDGEKVDKGLFWANSGYKFGGDTTRYCVWAMKKSGQMRNFLKGFIKENWTHPLYIVVGVRTRPSYENDKLVSTDGKA